MSLIGNKLFVEAAQVVMAIAPQDLTAGTTVNGDFVCLKNYHRCAVMAFFAAGTATTGDVTLSLQQATDVSNSLGDVKDLNFTRIDTKQATLVSSVGTFTANTQTAAANYTSTTSGETQGVWIVDVDPTDLDIDNDFDCLRANIAAAGGSTKLAGVFYFLFGPKLAATPLPSAIID